MLFPLSMSLFGPRQIMVKYGFIFQYKYNWEPVMSRLSVLYQLHT